MYQVLLAPITNYLPNINGRFYDTFGGKSHLNEGTFLIRLSVKLIFVRALKQDMNRTIISNVNQQAGRGFFLNTIV